MRPNQFIERESVDIQNPQHSHQEWKLANDVTIESLDIQCKEPKHLIFFIGAVYQFTYNKEKHFTQSQLALLL